MQIALIKPCWRYPIAGADHTYNRRWPPLELLNCGAILEAQGHQVRLIDAQAEDLTPEATSARVGQVDLALVTSSALDRWQCPTLELAPVVAMMKQVRGVARQMLLTGFHGTVHPEPMLDMTGADAVIRGEPEPTIAEVAEGRPWPEILGLTFRRDGRTVSTDERPPARYDHVAAARLPHGRSAALPLMKSSALDSWFSKEAGAAHIHARSALA